MTGRLRVWSCDGLSRSQVWLSWEDGRTQSRDLLRSRSSTPASDANEELTASPLGSPICSLEDDARRNDPSGLALHDSLARLLRFPLNKSLPPNPLITPFPGIPPCQILATDELVRDERDDLRLCQFPLLPLRERKDAPCEERSASSAP